jgi:hypothetical protein
MRENQTTATTVEIEVQGKKVTLSQDIPNYEFEEGLAALLNMALLAESNLNE